MRFFLFALLCLAPMSAVAQRTGYVPWNSVGGRNSVASTDANGLIPPSLIPFGNGSSQVAQGNISPQETARALQAESVNSAAIGKEATDRANAVTGEQNRATTAEGVNASSIAAEVINRGIALTTEATIARAAEVAAQNTANAAVPTALLGHANWPPQLDSLGTAGSFLVVGRSLAARSSDVINVKDSPYGAKGDGVLITAPMSTTSGSKTIDVLTVAGWSGFTSADIGKDIGINGVGSVPTGGEISAIAVSNTGAGYTGLPTISVSPAPTGTGSRVAAPSVIMGVVSATPVSNGGSGCTGTTAAWPIYNVAHQPQISPAFSVTISGGVVTQLVPTNVGVWATDFPGTAADPIAAYPIPIVGCATIPTFALSMGVVGIGFGNQYYGSDMGWGYPYSANGSTITVSLSGGAPTTPATLGAVSMTPILLSLPTKITAVNNATEIVVASAPGVTQSNVSTNFTYGTLDTAAIQAAVTAGPNVYFPQSTGCYLTDLVNIPSNRVLFSHTGATLCMEPRSFNPMLACATNASNIEIGGLTFIGNLSTNIQETNAGNAISCANLSSDIYVHDNIFSQFVRHVISLDGITRPRIINNTVHGSWFGSGIQVNSANESVNAIITGNHVDSTQLAGIAGGMNGGIISGNTVEGSNEGVGNSASDQVQDCITGYNADPTNLNVVVANNVLTNCGNNGIHWGGDQLVIANNKVYFARLTAIRAARSPNNFPTPEHDVQIIGNYMIGKFSQSTQYGGIEVGNLTSGVIADNIIDTVSAGITVTGYGISGSTPAAPTTGVMIHDNIIKNTAVGITFQNNVQNSYVHDNVFSNDFQGILFSGAANGAKVISENNRLFNNNFDNVTTNIIAEGAGAGDFNTYGPDNVLNGSSLSTIYIGVGPANTHSTFLLGETSIPVGSLPLASVFKGQCIGVTGSSTSNIQACSNGTNWLWVKDNSIVTN